jgi:formylglycine-generating enzyme required for sulfatase activity
MAWGQDKKVAMLEPVVKGGSVTQIEKEIILAALEEAITNIPGYRAFTRLDVNQIAKELSFQRSGMVDDEQRKRIGAMSGASLICISQLTAGTNILIKSSLVDVETGEIVHTANQLMEKDEIAIYQGCAGLVTKMFGNSSGSGGSSASGNNRVSTQRHLAEPEMVFVQGGTFWMGCTSEQGSCENDENPVHEVTVSSFYMGKYEVTQAQWEALMGSNPSHFKGGNLPVGNVNWNDVQMFIERLNAATGKQYRLPTEAEWEYAARGGNKSKGNQYSGSSFVKNAAWMATNSDNATHPAGTKMANKLGIYDMSGNVWEWCYDWYGYYSASTQNNPTGASSGSLRVRRGGCWDDAAGYCRVANRSSFSPSFSNDFLGFRLACSSE